MYYVLPRRLFIPVVDNVLNDRFRKGEIQCTKMRTIIPKIVTYLLEPVMKEKVFPEKGIPITCALVFESVYNGNTNKK